MSTGKMCYINLSLFKRQVILISGATTCTVLIGFNYEIIAYYFQVTLDNKAVVGLCLSLLSHISC